MLASNPDEARQYRQVDRGTPSGGYRPRDGGEWPVNYMLGPNWRNVEPREISPQTAVPAGAFSGRCAPISLGTHRSTNERTGSISINSAQEVRTIVNVKKVMVKKGVTLSLGNFENQRLEVMMEAEIHSCEEWDEATAELAARVNSVLTDEAEPALSLLSDEQREDWLIRLHQLPTAQQIEEGLRQNLALADLGANPADGPDNHNAYLASLDTDDDDHVEHLRADDDGMPPASASAWAFSDDDLAEAVEDEVEGDDADDDLDVFGDDDDEGPSDAFPRDDDFDDDSADDDDRANSDDDRRVVEGDGNETFVS